MHVCIYECSSFAWSSIAQSVCQRAFSLLEIRFQSPHGFESCIQKKTTCLLSIRENRLPVLGANAKRQWGPFDLKVACLCQSIGINNNKHVYRQSQVRKPNCSGVDWADYSLIIGTGYWVQVFSLILDSSVGLSSGIQSAGDSVPRTPWVRILHAAEEDNLSPFDLKSLACVRASESTITNTCISPEPGAKAKWHWDRVDSMLADNRDGLLSSSFLAWFSIAQSVCQQAFSLLANRCLRPWVRILHSAEEVNLSSFRFEYRLPVPEHRI